MEPPRGHHHKEDGVHPCTSTGLPSAHHKQPIPFNRLSTVAAFLSVLAVHGQETGLPPSTPSVDPYIYGTVRDMATRDSLPGASIRLFEHPSGQELLHLVTNERGRYQLKLNRTGIFRPAFSDEGRVAKIVEIDLTGVPDSLWAGGVAMNVEITLFEALPGVDYSVLDEPIARRGTTRNRTTWPGTWSTRKESRNASRHSWKPMTAKGQHRKAPIIEPPRSAWPMARLDARHAADRFLRPIAERSRWPRFR